MAQFYASIKGSRGEVTRLGHKSSGIEGHIRGWDIGVKVVMSHENGKDVCRIYATGGSNDTGGILIAKFDNKIDAEYYHHLLRQGATS